MGFSSVSLVPNSALGFPRRILTAGKPRRAAAESQDADWQI